MLTPQVAFGCSGKTFLFPFIHLADTLIQSNKWEYGVQYLVQGNFDVWEDWDQTSGLPIGELIINY